MLRFELMSFFVLGFIGVRQLYFGNVLVINGHCCIVYYVVWI